MMKRWISRKIIYEKIYIYENGTWWKDSFLKTHMVGESQGRRQKWRRSHPVLHCLHCQDDDDDDDDDDIDDDEDDLAM